MNKLKFQRIHILLILIAVVGVLTALQSCSSENDSLNSNSNSEYLDISSTASDNLSESDMIIICKAIQRLDISHNGSYVIKQINGAQVNISEKLYQFIKDSYSNTNNLIKLRFVSFKNVRLKNASEGVDTASNQNSITKTDCVANSIAGMGGVSYAEANAWIVSTYGNDGVPVEKMDEAITHFYPNATSSSIYSFPSGFMSNALIYFKVDETSGHAVNALYYDAKNGTILYKDNQNNGATGVISVDKVINVYKKN